MELVISDSECRPAPHLVSALEAVRRATAECHRRLEALPVQARILRDEYSVAEYRALLLRTYGFYLPLAETARSLAHAHAFAHRIAARSGLLRADLLDLGFRPAELDGAPRCAALPPLDTPDRLLGCAYVFEGSTLGGRAIFKHLERIFAGQGLPLRFFAGAGDATGPDWRRFCHELNAEAENVAELCAAAATAFDRLGAWLQAQPAEHQHVA